MFLVPKAHTNKTIKKLPLEDTQPKLLTRRISKDRYEKVVRSPKLSFDLFVATHSPPRTQPTRCETACSQKLELKLKKMLKQVRSRKESKEIIDIGKPALLHTFSKWLHEAQAHSPGDVQHMLERLLDSVKIESSDASANLLANRECINHLHKLSSELYHHGIKTLGAQKIMAKG